MAGCRDCRQCTRSVIGKLLWAFLRLLWILLASWNVGLFMKKCPQCNHYMRWHQKIEGRFID